MPAALAQIPSFIFGGNAPAKTPQEAARNRAVYEQIAARLGTAPQNVGEGLSAVGQAFLGRSMMDRANAGEEAGRASAARLAAGLADGADMAELTGVLADPWAMESPGTSAIASALLKREMDKGDPAFMLDMDLKRAQLAAATAPQPMEPPQVETRYNPETGMDEKVQWNASTGTWEAFGGQKAPDAPLISGPLIDNGGADAEFYKAGAKTRGEQFAAVETAGYQAQTKIGQINRLEQLLATAPQGVEGAWKQLAGEFGLPSEGLSDIQAAQSLINKMVPEQRTPGSGPMSDADLALFKQSMPRIINQPGGNELIIQTLKGIAVYEQQMGEIATKVLNKEITPAQGRAEMAAVQNPLELFQEGGGKASDTPPAGVDPSLWENMTPEERALWN